jgi:hypothetical protein
MLDPRKIAMQGVGAQPLLMALQGFLISTGPPQPPPAIGGLVYSPMRAALRSPVRDVVRWSA